MAKLLNLFIILLYLGHCLLVRSPEHYLYELSDDDNCHCIGTNVTDIAKAIDKTVKYVESVQKVNLIPGVVVGVGIKGQNVMIRGFGETDIENNLQTRDDSVWRMASISKSLTSALIGRLMEKGLIDLQKSIHSYLRPEVFPVKQWMGKDVVITVEQVMSHSAGLRVTKFPEDFREFLDYKNATESVRQFRDEPLISAPGTQFNYSNYGFQLVGAIIESIIDEPYETAINRMFRELGMNGTVCERHDQILAHRSRYYIRSDSPYLRSHHINEDKLKLYNAFIADDVWSANSWLTSAGVVSTANDLLHFGNYMINSYYNKQNSDLLKSTTVQKLWEPVIEMGNYSGIGYYTHGWGLINLDHPITCDGKCQMAPIKRYYWHSGGLSGVTTMLVVMPDQHMVVTVLTNINPFDPILDMALNITKNFIQ